ncbi:YHS domain-containing (seleno)protein [Roseivirga sp. E12]|uniref:YHS domain-containing (seleno)protein n=1 Tax=Roseivirga sp. E12 TaxID=2819237 RepID=UPI001ABC4BF9|nr:YHS domain-containing (seleno)protein [Roseivirga sp. E12]MBO3699280.1 YHS domain protein [Roseivirga sp. E12]
MKRSIILLSFYLFGLVGVHSSFAQSSGYDLKHYNLKRGLAIQGYDPVAYFTDNKAIEGSDKISHIAAGVTYYFSSAKNRQLFIANPEKYEPEYGGYCAYAMADGDKVRIDPETFKIIDGKLYLFYNFRFTNTLKSWNKDQVNLLPKANTEWSKIVSGG